MKAYKFDLKSFPMKAAAGGEFKYRDVLVMILSAPRQSGFQITEVRQRLKMIEKIEAPGDLVYFTEPEYLDLKTKINQFQWGMISKEIVQFVDEFEAAPEVPMTEGVPQATA